MIRVIGFCLLTISTCSAIANDAEDLFRKLEQRLLQAEEWRFTSVIDAENAVTAHFEGTTHFQKGNRVTLTQKGHFAGTDTALKLNSDGNTMTHANHAQEKKSATPAHLNQGMTIGFTRMGLLHNLAMLYSASPPDRTDGSAEEWVVVHRFEPLERVTLEGRPADKVAFSIQVGGKPSGKAALWIDRETGYPVRREQTVEFPNGAMNVVERYAAFSFSSQDPLAVVERFVAAFNRHDVKAMLDAVHDDVIWFSVDGATNHPEASGKDALEKGMTGYFTQLPSVRSSLEDAFVVGQTVSVKERAAWKNAEGEERSQAAIGVYEVVGGKIKRCWYFPASR
ncbi:Nuclear transport factor 2 family protein [Sulfidibacter corallicola]|uniref:Nuclear transport factor 2 family protein n=1 Tax=Sulfidibacter corallicola TaxID=2818388 RepID=A0A8A4TTZ1_SULCO|nr:nuclear transport factor 2 family protein [Sulfidibacter corallicola]QTD52837.1 nuclear transport factor 2 family protein [Sulfidibacter corallicola]